MVDRINTIEELEEWIELWEDSIEIGYKALGLPGIDYHLVERGIEREKSFIKKAKLKIEELRNPTGNCFTITYDEAFYKPDLEL